MMNNTPANATERLARLDPVYQREALGALQAAEARMSADFIERVHSLTPELYEMVKGYIFHSGCAFHIERQVVKVDKDYRPPALLQVDRHTSRCLSPTLQKKPLMIFKDFLSMFDFDG
ncbi:hypothetical protein B0A50_00646 [Salinomyces thailandicus]|uniref:Uncharacterized protein n=1 Tax=Salinomyces thailandicus TaxID=706561 RepID=A0A4V5N7U0_9PEZI|nr:hypothetical protein B0A50_00646 [Salinomyces thailandica]